MDDKKGMGPGSLDDNNKRWCLENMDLKNVWTLVIQMITIRDGTLRIWMIKRYLPQGVRMITIRDGPLRIWM
jgi:hypothetical protein